MAHSRTRHRSKDAWWGIALVVGAVALIWLLQQTLELFQDVVNYPGNMFKP